MTTCLRCLSSGALCCVCGDGIAPEAAPPTEHAPLPTKRAGDGYRLMKRERPAKPAGIDAWTASPGDWEKRARGIVIGEAIKRTTLAIEGSVTLGIL